MAVFAPPYRVYHYAWPAQLGAPQEAVRVRVPFGRSVREGVIVEPDAPRPDGVALKAVIDRLDADPLYDARRCAWVARLGRYYLAQPGEVWGAALGWARCLEARRVRPVDPSALAAFDAELARAMPDRRARRLGGLRRAGVADAGWRVARALAAGVLEEERVEPPEVCADRAPLPTPSDEQRRAAAAIEQALGSFRVFVLHGPTGAGKTEAYLLAAEAAARRGLQTLVLLPEIALTPQWLARAARRLARVAPWHSGLGARERLGVVSTLDRLDALVGARSALFPPLPRLGLIVIDEEHDGSFKAQDAPAIHAREAALLLAQRLEVPVVLGSATPSAEAWRLVEQRRAEALHLTRRFAVAPRPAIEVVDLRGVDGPISPTLAQALGETFAAGGQAMLYLNRRAYAPALQCLGCGETIECPHCTVRLALHRRDRALRCHLCGHAEPAPRACPACGELALMPAGAGSERLEDELAARFPGVRVARLDRDAVRSHARLQTVLDRFRRGAIDALVGTQMLVKGHDFPGVTLVAVVHADLGLGAPDFRAAERWRQQLVQVIGRAGRGARAGRVIVQTRQPDAPWLREALTRPWLAQLEAEMSLRRALGFPPFARWVRVVFESRTRAKAAEAAAGLAARAQGIGGVETVGPAPCPVERIEGRWRFEVVWRDPSRKRLPWAAAPLLADPPPAGVRRVVDVDPWEWA